MIWSLIPTILTSCPVSVYTLRRSPGNVFSFKARISLLPPVLCAQGFFHLVRFPLALRTQFQHLLFLEALPDRPSLAGFSFHIPSARFCLHLVVPRGAPLRSFFLLPSPLSPLT